MPAVSKAQQRFMGMVHAAQTGEKPASPEVAKVAKDMGKKDVKDFASTKHKDLPDHITEEMVQQLKEKIRGIVKEMTGSDAAGDYNSPFAFTKKGGEKAKGKKQAKLTGYTVVEEEKYLDADIMNLKRIKYKPVATKKGQDGNKDKEMADVSDMEYVQDINENRWMDLKKEDSSATSKVNRGISNINKQLAEVEKFLNWYGRIKNENGVTNEHFWKRTNSNIYKIKERLIKLEQQIRKISE
jgi:hypothetical protein